MDLKSAAIIENLKSAPLLAGDLPLVPTFDRSLFGDVQRGAGLNFDQKLGHLYEQALGGLINSSPSLSCLASHLQVFSDTRRTLGEMDFILRDHTSNQHIHLELAVKFYLARKSPDGWQFPGPNANDNWQRKLDHMLQRQLTLSQAPEAQTLLYERFNIKEIKVQQLIYGCLFIPLECHDIPRPQFMSPSRQEGRWLYARQWSENLSSIKEALLIPKPLWPVEISSETRVLFEKASVETLIEQGNERCTMFALKDTDQKMFLVPDTWD